MSTTGLEYAAVSQDNSEELFFDLQGDRPIAWEAVNPPNGNTSYLGPSTVYQLSYPSDGVDEDSYYTLALSANEAHFNKRYLRQVKKAQSGMVNPTIQLAEIPSQIRRAVDMFTPHPERRDHLPMSAFQRRIAALSDAGLLLAYVLCDGKDALGVSLALRTDTQVNLRFYSAQRQMGAGHLLHYLSIKDMFNSQGIDTIDLSGVSPHSIDPKLCGINEFKQQIGGDLIEFKRLDINM